MSVSRSASQGQRRVWSCWRIDLSAVVLLVGATVAAYALWVGPVLGQHAQFEAMAGELRSRQGELAAKRQEERSLEARLGTARQALAEADIRLEPLSNLNRRLTKLTDLATECGLVIEGVEPGKTVAGAAYGRTTIRLTGRGSFHEASRFINRVQTTLRDTAVTSVDLTGQPGAGRGPVAQAGVPAGFTLDLVWHTAPAGVVTQNN
jgi:Tfp pilus assembly protein PilO